MLRKTVMCNIMRYIRVIIFISRSGGKNMSEINEKWSSLEETAEYLGVTKDTIRSWIKKTDIPAHKVGRGWKYKPSEVDVWIKSGQAAE